MSIITGTLKLALAGGLVLALTACEGMNPQEQRTLSGGAIGAGAGAIVGAAAFGNPAAGSAIGGASGAAIGATTH